MSEFEVLERIEAVAGELPFKVQGKTVVVGARLDDEQLDAALASIAPRIGMISYQDCVTIIELV